LPGIYFEHFYRILVYPDDYYSTITHRYHKGEVNTKGLIVLSWRNLLKGYQDDSDGRNLGLHEMAHALKIVDAIKTEEYNFMDQEIYHQFLGHSRMEMQRIINGEESFFRDYAAANDYEFFAVAVENFFERPQEFKNHHSRLFDLLSQLLNQNTLRLQSNGEHRDPRAIGKKIIRVL
jgi:MtfA peptidase